MAQLVSLMGVIAWIVFIGINYYKSRVKGSAYK
jgi:hypothetical protein